MNYASMIQQIIDKQDMEQKRNSNASSLFKKERERATMYESVQEINNSIEEQNRNYTKFIQDVNEGFLFEALYTICSESLSGIYCDRKDALLRHSIKKFIAENGASTIIRTSKKKSLLLNEMCNIIEESVKNATKNADKKDTASLNIDSGLKDDFHDKISGLDLDSVRSAVANRVSSALNDFINDNIVDKVTIKSILDKTQEKVNKSEKDSIKEEFTRLAKKNINEYRTKREKGVLEQMIYNVCESTMKNKQLSEQYTKDGKIDMDSIVDECSVVYGFLETLNTIKIKKIDAQYISEMLEKLK